MPDRPTLSSAASRPGHRLAAGLVATCIAVAALATVPFGGIQLPANASFLPAFGALTLVTELLTAALLLSQAVITRDRSPLRLAAAYLYSALSVVSQMAAFPGVLRDLPFIARPDAAVWLWLTWHGGLAFGIVGFALGRPAALRRGDVARTLAGTGLAVAVPVIALTMADGWLPILLQGGSYARVNTLGIGPAVLAAAAIAGILVLSRLRLRCPLSIWLAVSMLALSVDVALTLHGGGRFTFGWYAARMLSLVTGVTMLVALLSELSVQGRRVGDLNVRLEQMLHTDTLTGLSNRRAFAAVMETEWRRSRREQTPLSLLTIDIDFFKLFNDNHGHPAGDSCLHAVGAALAQRMQRPADLVARMGGEEFVLLLPGTSEAGAALVAERVREAVAELAIVHRGRLLSGVTVSIGVATRRPSDRMNDPAVLLDASDRALYRAKAAGRNRVCYELQPVRDVVAVHAA